MLWNRRPKRGNLHGNAPVHKARIETEYLEAEKVTVLSTSPSRFLKMYPRATSFCSPNLNLTYLQKRTNHEMSLGLQ
jgi:hypothetical protein